MLDFVEASKLGFTSDAGYMLLEEVKGHYNVKRVEELYTQVKQWEYKDLGEFTKYFRFFNEIVAKNSHKEYYEGTISKGYKNKADRMNGEGTAAFEMSKKIMSENSDWTPESVKNRQNWIVSKTYEILGINAQST